MKEGFYTYKNNIYYGSYDETQVSGQWKVSTCKPEYIQTDHPIKEDDWAAQLWDNHRLLEPEYTDLQAMLLKMASFQNITTEQNIDFSMTEERLKTTIPKELKQIYNAIHNQEEYFTSTEHFLPLDELYITEGILVFFKKKRNPIAGYDIESGCLAGYDKKEWFVEPGDVCCYQFCVGRMITITLENKPVTKKGRCKGKLVTTLNIEKELEAFCNEKYHLLTELNTYGIAVMYSNENLIAWIRSNGFYADIHAGADDEAHLQALGEHLGQITWK